MLSLLCWNGYRPMTILDVIAKTRAGVNIGGAHRFISLCPNPCLVPGESYLTRGLCTKLRFMKRWCGIFPPTGKNAKPSGRNTEQGPHFDKGTEGLVLRPLIWSDQSLFGSTATTLLRQFPGLREDPTPPVANALDGYINP